MINRNDLKKEFLKLSRRFEKYIQHNHIFHIKMKNSLICFYEDNDKPSTGRVYFPQNEFPTFEFYFNSVDSLNYLRFIMLHEQAHLLFSSNSILPYEIVESDNSYALSNLTRAYYTEDNNTKKKYGYYLEEVMATYIAYYVLLNEGLVDKNFLRDVICSKKFQYSYTSFVLLRRIINAFYTDKGKNKKLDDEIVVDNTFLVPTNHLLHMACVGNASFFINNFNKTIKVCTWKDFVENYEKVILSKNPKDCIKEKEFVVDIIKNHL